MRFLKGEPYINESILKAGSNPRPADRTSVSHSHSPTPHYPADRALLWYLQAPWHSISMKKKKKKKTLGFSCTQGRVVGSFPPLLGECTQMLGKRLSPTNSSPLPLSIPPQTPSSALLCISLPTYKAPSNPILSSPKKMQPIVLQSCDTPGGGLQMGLT